MRLYKRKLVYLSDRYSHFELNVIQALRTKQAVVVPGHIIVANLVDAGIVRTEDHTFLGDECVFASVTLTDVGRDLIDHWIDPEDSALTY